MARTRCSSVTGDSLVSVGFSATVVTVTPPAATAMAGMDRGRRGRGRAAPPATRVSARGLEHHELGLGRIRLQVVRVVRVQALHQVPDGRLRLDPLLALEERAVHE